MELNYLAAPNNGDNVIFNSPLSTTKADHIITALNLKSDHKVVDIGCGEGEFLTRIQQQSDADCLGVDVDSSCIESATKKAQQHDISNKLEFLLADVGDAKLKKDSFDLAVCIGSTHAFGEGEAAYENALKQMSDLLKPNGLILIGEGYWKQNPEQAYLDFLGDPAGIYNSHEQNIQQAESLGFIPMYAATSNQDEWDHFEWCFRMKAEQGLIAAPGNEAAQEKVKRVREWNRYYRKFGRDTMGFGFYLYLKSS